MYLESLYIRNFRNIKELSLSFSQRVNVIHGSNAQGKTNILEAIVLLSTSRSFRTRHWADFVRFGEESFLIEARIVKSSATHTVCLKSDGKTKELVWNGSHYSNVQPLIGLLPSTLFEPRDIDLIIGPSAIRRKLMDLHLSQIDPDYLSILVRYNRAMKQRNASLQKKQIDGITYFEQEMAELAQFLFQKRSVLIQSLSQDLLPIGRELSSEKISLSFLPSFSDITTLQQQWEQNREKEMELGLTLVGPHRDDFSIYINDQEAKTFASEGQKRSILAALRLAQWHRQKNDLQAPGLFIVDDLDLHLDDERKSIFQKTLSSLSQVFITTPHAMPSMGTNINIINGSIPNMTQNVDI